MNAHDVLMFGHAWVHKHVDGLTEDQWLLPDVCGYWSTKDIIAHLASYECVLEEVFQNLIAPASQGLTLDQLIHKGDQFNDIQVGLRQGYSPADVLLEYDEAFSRAMQLLPGIDKRRLSEPGTLPWYGQEYSLEDFIVYQYYGHKREHMAQVAILLDKLKV